MRLDLLSALGGLLLICLAGTQAKALSCEDVKFRSNSYTLCRVDPAKEDLRLFLTDTAGDPFGHFSKIDEALAATGQRLGFATNGGMYHEDRSPVGHYLEDGREVMRVVPNAGPGNFGLLPNGVLCIHPDWARVIETLRFVREKPPCRHASQSGPMLMIDGAMHPAFKKDSTSRFIRNGVGASADGSRLVFAISNNTVNFHEFAELFRDYLDLPDALFIDGNVSRLHAPSIGRSDRGRWLGPIVGVVEPIR